MQPNRANWLYALLPVAMLALFDLAQMARFGFSTAGHVYDTSDTLLRIAFLREVAATGSWHDNFFDRSNAPGGFTLHWTHVFNWIVLAIHSVFQRAGARDSWYQAAFWTGPLMRLAFCPAMFWSARAVMSPASAAGATAFALFCTTMSNYGGLGTANYHVWLYLLAAVLAGFAIRTMQEPARPVRAVMLGLVAALALWSGFELIAFDTIAFAMLFLEWIVRGRPVLGSLLRSLSVFALCTLGVFLADPPPEGLSSIALDRVSLPYVAFAGLQLCMAGGLLLCRAEEIRARAIFLGIASIIAASVWALFFGADLKGIEASLDPVYANELMPILGELSSVGDLASFFVLVMPGIVAALAIALYVRPRVACIAACGLLLLLSVLAQAHFRLSGYLAIAVALAMGHVISLSMGTYKLRAFALSAVLGIFWLGGMMDVRNAVDRPEAGLDKACSVETIDGLLNDPAWLKAPVRDPIFMTVPDESPDIIFYTGHRTVGADYHRAGDGIRDTFLFMRDRQDSAAEAIAQRRGVAFVLVCTTRLFWPFQYDNTRQAMAKDGPPQNTLYNRLIHNQPPAWLTPRPWPVDIRTGLRLYQVDLPHEETK